MLYSKVQILSWLSTELVSCMRAAYILKYHHMNLFVKAGAYSIMHMQAVIPHHSSLTKERNHLGEPRNHTQVLLELLNMQQDILFSHWTLTPAFFNHLNISRVYFMTKQIN